MAQVTITQVRSLIGGTSAQRNSMRSIGLKRIGHSVTKQDTPQLRGMISVVSHLVDVKEES